MDWGNFDLQIVSDGTLWLDGGAMFGVVPKAIWGKLIESDENNRIRLGMNCLLIRNDEKTILIDTGCGSKLDEKARSIYRISSEVDLVKELHSKGVEPEDVDIVINTHLHFDHCGGNTDRIGNTLQPRFPNATYFVQRTEFEDASSPNERTRASYFSENWQILLDRDQLHLLEGEEEVVPGVQCIPTPGHTRGHQSVKIESGGRKLFFIADLCPTHLHVPLPWIMGYDHFPLTTLETRKAIYSEAAHEDWLILFEHDPEVPSGHLRFEDDRWSVVPVGNFGALRY